MTDPHPIDRDTWARINDLFHRAVETLPEHREAFLDEVGENDPRIRAEVTSLLAAHERAANFIETPAVQTAPLAAASPATPLPDRIGHYQVIRLLGEGGMGVVYLAEDTRLGRTVALKAIARDSSGDSSRRERLRHEARAAASLNHPGIAAVYALEEIDAEIYIAGEYVPGETLREELARGALEPARAIETTLSIVRALAVAHERGIVHRDLKPENVIRTTGGEIKILDFGLARFRDPRHPAPAMTIDGAILGTPAYMSPEQLRGGSVDARSDLFSLGIMLYELATGVHPFASGDRASTIARILEAEPAALASRLPAMPAAAIATLDRVVSTALQKSPEARFRSAGEMGGALEDASEILRSGGAAPMPFDSAQGGAKVAQWWWQFHQAAAAAGYALLLIPLWRVRDMTTGSPGTWLFLAGLISVVIASSLRLHLWFGTRLDRPAWAELSARSGRWILAADLIFVSVLMIEGVLALSAHEPWALLLVAAAASALVSFAIIEPATARAAFGDRAK